MLPTKSRIDLPAAGRRSEAVARSMAKFMGIHLHLCDPGSGEPLKHYEMMGPHNRSSRFVAASPGQPFYLCVHVPGDFPWERCNALLLSLHLNTRDAMVELPILRPTDARALTLNINKWPVWALTPEREAWSNASFRFRQSRPNEVSLLLRGYPNAEGRSI